MKEIVTTLFMSGFALMLVVVISMAFEPGMQPSVKARVWVTRSFNLALMLFASGGVLLALDVLALKLK